MAKYFTVEEANALIPELTEIVTELRSIRARLMANQRQADRVAGAAKRNGHNLPVVDLPTLQGQSRQLSTRLSELIERVRAMGAQVKDLEMGLIDFPSRRDDRDILLCWRLGEDAIRFYHDPESGFAGRQPL